MKMGLKEKGLFKNKKTGNNTYAIRLNEDYVFVEELQIKLQYDKFMDEYTKMNCFTS